MTAPSIEKLKGKLATVSSNILSGKLDAAQLEGADHRAYLAAAAALRPWKLAVDVAAREYAAARDILGPVTLLDAVRFYQRHAAENLREISAQDAVVEFLTAKESEGASHEYRKQIRKDLTRFAATFGGRLLSDLRSPELIAWLDTCGHKVAGGGFAPPGAARRNQIRGTLITLFRFARERHHLVRERQTQAEHIPRVKHARGAIVILSPPHFRLLLELTAQLEPVWLPYFVLAGFCGIRVETLRRLDWRAIRWEGANVEVPAAQSKINRRYIAPLPPAAVAWLEDWRNARGPITPKTNPRHLLQRIVRRAGWKSWPKNALRKSFISYRMAILKNANAVALEANNSPAEIFENYREVCTPGGDLVTEALAEQFFGVMPADCANVVPMTPHLPF